MMPMKVAEEVNQSNTSNASVTALRTMDDILARGLQFQFAAETGNLDTICRLVQVYGVGVNSRPMVHCYTALHAAATHGHYQIVQFLLENNADVNAKDGLDRSPLHSCFQLGGGNIRVAQLLLDHEADITAIDENGQTILHYAIINRASLEAVQFLLDNKADITARGAYGETALQCSLRFGDDLVVQYLIDHETTDIEATNHYGKTALHYASRWRGLALVQCLIRRKADIRATTNSGETALHSAVKWGADIEVVRLLIENKVDVTATNESGETALHSVFRCASTSRRDLALVQCLLDHGVDVNSINKRGQTVLHLAIRCGVDVEIVQCLLNHKADVNANDDSGRTPLHCICERVMVNAPVMELLLSHNADVLTKDHALKVPLHLLACSNSTDAVTVLFDRLRSNSVPMDSVLMCVDNDGRLPFQFVRSAAMAKLLLEQPLLPGLCHDMLFARDFGGQSVLEWERGDSVLSLFGWGRDKQLREYLLSYTDSSLIVPARTATCEHCDKRRRLEVKVRINPMLNEFQSSIADKFLDTWDGWSTSVQQDGNKTASTGVEQELLLPVELKRAVMSYLVLADIMQIV